MGKKSRKKGYGKENIMGTSKKGEKEGRKQGIEKKERLEERKKE